MNNIYFVTYATHEAGMFKKLINNHYNVKIDVLGYNTKWNGFTDKIIAMEKYSKTNNPNSIIVFLDGFDTLINKDVSRLEKDFKEFNTRIVVSYHPETIQKIILEKVFTSCDGKNIANSGLYMGYAKDLNIMCKKMLSIKTKDDQRSMNIALKDLDFKVDENNIIFKNYYLRKEKSDRINNNNNPYFVSYPGGTNNTIKYKLIRYIRSIKEYSKYFLYEFYILILVILLIVLIIKKYRK
jgi:hypothetical protein